ncbi:interferon-induced protein 44-like isoform X3 [Acipenser ruthenus]|uniref:interferon-induced protein 44-like isoform X3 n=1 Tax=Acipenser ruthenus TaxID=7906 RepID=UPI002741D1F2|nr:interferon-induced protein 44-like isoform X3 [Acipenser ruthenus]
MGGLLSKEPPKPEPLLPIPWREVEFRHEAYMKLQDEIKNYQPHPKASTTNILILGNVGSGKSSFLNSMFSELRREDFNGRIQSFQGVRPPAQTSVTQRFDDILETKIKMEGDQIHCVVLVLSLHNAENLDPALIQFYEGLIGMLTKTGVPCKLLVTFVDKLVEKTEDLKDLYKRRDIKQKIEKLAKEMRISMCNVIVVSNYFEELKINQIKGTLLLEAVAQMLTAAKPFQERM